MIAKTNHISHSVIKLLDEYLFVCQRMDIKLVFLIIKVTNKSVDTIVSMNVMTSSAADGGTA